MASFTKLLSETDVGARFAVPTSALQNIPIDDGNHYVYLPVLYNNEQWSFRCSIRRDGHPKPVFNGPWLDFVRQKGLRVGDKVIFHMQDNEANGAQYRIEVKERSPYSVMKSGLMCRRCPIIPKLKYLALNYYAA